MNPDKILALFFDLTVELAAVLDELNDWDETGARAAENNTQYRHDVVADQLVVPRLVAEGFNVLSEESGLARATPEAAVTVVVDPIDGSTNAARGLPWYAVSLCAVDRSGPLVGLVANLETGDAFRAVRGQGAEGPEGMLRPSRCDSLSDAVLALSGLPPAHGGWSQFRVYGAAALDLCSVASGVFDGFVDVDGAHAPWDYLAAALVCEEAGAFIDDGQGRPLTSLVHSDRRQPVAAGSPELMAELMAMVADWA